MKKLFPLIFLAFGLGTMGCSGSEEAPPDADLVEVSGGENGSESPAEPAPEINNDP
jgi:hypothetical protein